MPSWEFGVLVQIRDMSREMRLDFSRSQSQSAEDRDLSEAEGKFYWDNTSWVFPDTEGEYRKGIEYLERYMQRLADPNHPDAEFYPRADNLRNWLTGVSTRLGSLSQRLSSAVGKRQLNTGLAGDSSRRGGDATPGETEVKTPWLEIDDVFYEARGHTWALLHLLHAIDHDFKDVLEKKNARISLQQIIRELEPTQASIWSPMVLNGDGLGLVANHSLVMASYISRANAAIIDLRNLLGAGLNASLAVSACFTQNDGIRAKSVALALHRRNARKTAYLQRDEIHAKFDEATKLPVTRWYSSNCCTRKSSVYQTGIRMLTKRLSWGIDRADAANVRT